MGAGMMAHDKNGEAFDILTRAHDYWKPNWIFFLFSGGYDSICSTHIGWAWARDKSLPHIKVISADTGVAADGWREYVTLVGLRERWVHEVWNNPQPDFYYQNAREFGFPFTKEMHGMIMYRNLKERTFDAVRRAHKVKRRDRCMLVTGMRRDESTDRANTPEWIEDGAGLWVSPLVNWTKRDVYEYRLVHAFEPNPFYETVGGSGDCECNWGQFTDIDTLERYSPKLAAKIRPLHEECLTKFGYGYGERGDNEYLLAERAGQQTLPGIEPIVNLCASCSRAKPDASQALEWRQLQEGW
jgi:3'-phosphoadenosine 5'-phosphosulfate sulfotransferase (PAPS reductase)/FAD synthetase